MACKCKKENKLNQWLCSHTNLRYNKCCDTVECLDCGALWERQSWTITYPTVPYDPYTWPRYQEDYKKWNDTGTTGDIKCSNG